VSLPEVAALFHEERAALASARDELRREVLSALDQGMAEAEAARVAGVSRMTVRAWRAGS